MSKYNEIVKLHEMLLEAEIEHEFVRRNEHLRDSGFDWGYQIIVYRPDDERLISVIEGFGTYGEANDLLEIMGLLTPEEEELNSVCGWLTAEDVFERIERAVNENN